jgi:hypothetical protein
MTALTPKDLRVLVVEDVVNLHTSIVRSLQDCGYHGTPLSPSPCSVAHYRPGPFSGPRRSGVPASPGNRGHWAGTNSQGGNARCGQDLRARLAPSRPSRGDDALEEDASPVRSRPTSRADAGAVATDHI